jgi:cytochrome c oxidase subunit 4
VTEGPVTATPHAHKHFGPTQYLFVWIALLALTAATVAVWKMPMPNGAKAGLVALFFMHLWEHGGATRLVLATSVLFVALLIGLVLADNATRFQYANPPYSESWGEAPFEEAEPPMQGESGPVEVGPEAEHH